MTTYSARPPYNVQQPGAYSATSAAKVAAANAQSAAPIPVVVGTCLGGQPNTPLYFASPSKLQQVLRSGAAYDVARFMFDGGASQVGVVRIGNSITQAVLALTNASAQTVVTLTALDYGSWANSIQITVAAGPIITLTYTDPLGNVFTEQWNLTGVSGLTAAMVAQAINGQLYGYPASNYVTAVAGTGALPLSTITGVPLAGGTDGLTPQASDWSNGLTALEVEPIDVIVPATGDATVHAQVLTHCQNLSMPNARHERVMVAGGVLGESVSTVIARMASLRSGRAELVYPGIKDFNAQGVLTSYDPFYAAGKLAGMWCAQPDPATSILHQSVPVVDLEVYLSTVQGGALDQLLAAGVTPLAKQPGGGFWVVDAPTGYNLPDRIFRDMVTTRSVDFANQFMRNWLESQFVGSKGLTSTQASVTVESGKGLDRLVTQQIIESYQPPTVEPGPVIGSWNVTMPIQPIATNKFVFLNTQLQPSSAGGNSVTTVDTQG